MQKGFATLEIIFVVLIISLLASATVPNAVQIIDRVAFDYETKKIYTDLRFVQSFDRMAYMPNFHFENLDENIDSSVNLTVRQNYYVLEKNSDSKIFGEQNFSYGVTASKNENGEIWQIKFDDFGRISPAKSDHLTLTSGLGKEIYVIFNSVGRFRGSHILPADKDDY